MFLKENLQKRFFYALTNGKTALHYMLHNGWREPFKINEIYGRQLFCKEN